MKKEIWKDVAGYEGLYKISNIGRLMSLRISCFCRLCKSQMLDRNILKQSKNHDGYIISSLSKNGTTKIFRTHRLVAIAFISNPQNLELVDHINGDIKNNHVENLRWCTAKQNANYGNGKRKKRS